MFLANRKILCILGLFCLGLLIGNHVSYASECKIIRTTLDGSIFPCVESDVGLCADGTIGGGMLKGSKEAIYTAGAPSAGLPLEIEPPEVLSYSATAVFSTRHGELHLSQLGVSDPFRQVFTELNRVVGGTKRFANASGDLFISGTLNADSTEFESHVTGIVCLGHGITDPDYYKADD